MRGSETAGDKGAASPGVVDLQGAGATFPYPLYARWLGEYGKREPSVRINYQSIGSGGGIRQITERTVDFGATDVPMTAEELAKAPGIVHLPVTLGAVVLAYNLPELQQPLRLTPQLVAALYRGEIGRWNDPALAAANPGVTLPDRPVSVVFRTDGSGTTGVFTDYLARVSPEWKQQVGAGKSVRFPAGLGAKGNEGVTGQVKTTPGAIGYVELAYARQTKLPVAHLQNRAGQFVEPSLAAISAAAAGAELPPDLRTSIVDSPAAAAWPLASFSYILVYENQQNAEHGRALARFLQWAVRDGQSLGAALDYAPLPEPVVRAVEQKLQRLRADGRPLLNGQL